MDFAIAEVINLAKREADLTAAIRKTEDGREFLMDAEGQVTFLTNRRERPATIVAQRVFNEGESLANYANIYKVPASLFLASIDTQQVKVLLDYHDVYSPSNVEHTATWPVPFSDEFVIWQGSNKVAMPQEGFMRFLSENMDEIVKPDAASLLEVVSDFSSLTTVTFRSAKNLANGLQQLQYVEEGSSTQKGVTLPEIIELRMPIYRGEPAVDFEAYLRTRLNNGVLTMFYELRRINAVKQAAFRAAVDRIGKLCSMTPLYGKVD